MSSQLVDLPGSRLSVPLFRACIQAVEHRIRQLVLWQHGKSKSINLSSRSPARKCTERCTFGSELGWESRCQGPLILKRIHAVSQLLLYAINHLISSDSFDSTKQTSILFLERFPHSFQTFTLGLRGWISRSRQNQRPEQKGRNRMESDGTSIKKSRHTESHGTKVQNSKLGSTKLRNQRPKSPKQTPKTTGRQPWNWLCSSKNSAPLLCLYSANLSMHLHSEQTWSRTTASQEASNNAAVLSPE